MQQFLLNDKVITQLHMNPIDLKQRTKFAKKYDMPIHYQKIQSQRNIIKTLIQKQRKQLSKPNHQQPKNDQPSLKSTCKTKNLLSTLKFSQLFLTDHQNNNQPKRLIKQNCFTMRGIKKNINQFSSHKKILNRTGSLVSAIRFTDYSMGSYQVNPDIKFKRSPRCFISPQINKKGKSNKKKFIIIQEDKQNCSSGQNINKQKAKIGKNIYQKKQRSQNKQKQRLQKLTIKQIVDKQMQQLIKKRRAICRTAPTKHLQKINARNELSQQYNMLDEDICKVEAKIYLQMHENRQKAIKRNKQRIGINIDKNKPFTSLQINKNTVKLLKKYNCDNMVYFSKFVTKQ